MSKSPHHVILVSLALLSAGLLSGSLHAAEFDKTDWECRSCEFPLGIEADADGGVIFVSDDSAKFGDFTGLDEQGAYLDAHLNVQQWFEDGSRWQLSGRNLGLESREFGLGWDKQGHYGVAAYYSQIPRSLFSTTRTPFIGSGSENLTLPDDWVHAGSTGGMTALRASLQPLDVSYDREILGVNASYLPWQDLELTAEYRRDEKDGVRITNGSVLTVTSQFVQPLDYATDQLELTAGYRSDAWNLRLGYYGSFFDNGADRLRWQSPFSELGPGEPLVGQLDLAPDNDFHQVSLSGGYRFGRHTHLTGRWAVGQGEQDEAFLPYTLTSGLGAGPLPQSSLDGEVDTTNINLRLRSTLIRGLGLTAEFRKSERDNKTIQNQYDYVVTDSLPGGTAFNRPYSFDRDGYRVSADYRLWRRTRLSAGWNRDEIDRDFQEREKTENDKFWARVTIGFIPAVSGWVEVYGEERDGSAYVDVAQSNSPQNPLMRKYNLADRDRDAIEGRISVLAMDAWDFSFSAAWAEDEYQETMVGLSETDYLSATVDTSVRLGPASLYAAYTYEKFESSQAGSRVFNTPDWIGDTQDEFDTVAIGVKWPELFDRFDVNVDYTYAKSAGDVAMNVSNSRSTFPQLETELDSLRVYVDYRLREALKLRIGYWYEHFNSSDWSLDRVFPATVPQLLSLGATAHNYNVNTVLLSLNYAW
jgi:MtrB/PioB family decaheme-associated outer membrane protein